MESNKIVAIYTLCKEELYGGGVPFVVCNNKKEMEVEVMDLCRVTGSTAHKVGKHIFIIKR